MPSRRARLALRLLGLALLASACDPGADAPCEDEDDTPYLLAIDEDEGTRDALIRISVEPGHVGEVEVLCEDLELPPGLPADTNFTSLAENHGYLYASASRQTWGDTLVRIDPCACTATEVGSYGFELVSGLASNRAGQLFGLAAEGDALIEIDPLTANSESRTPLADNWDSNGLSPGEGDILYGLDATGDRLHTFSARTGASRGYIELTDDYAAAGIEWQVGVLYACGLRDDDTALVAISPHAGTTSVVAEGVFTTTCDNLAGSTAPILCPD